MKLLINHLNNIGIGIGCGYNIIGVDIDNEDPSFAKYIEDEFIKRYGDTIRKTWQAWRCIGVSH